MATEKQALKEKMDANPEKFFTLVVPGHNTELRFKKNIKALEEFQNKAMKKNMVSQARTFVNACLVAEDKSKLADIAIVSPNVHIDLLEAVQEETSPAVEVFVKK